MFDLFRFCCCRRALAGGGFGSCEFQYWLHTQSIPFCKFDNKRNGNMAKRHIFLFRLFQPYMIEQCSNYLDVASNYDITISRDIFDVFVLLFLKMNTWKVLFDLLYLFAPTAMSFYMPFAFMRIISFNFVFCSLSLSLHFIMCRSFEIGAVDWWTAPIVAATTQWSACSIINGNPFGNAEIACWHQGL